ncbi:MAG: hypothetical protein GY874_14365 [Desulfobacteraceae bacterium]|nr:hypothetical protein [Desulfobacteraceae bacterium]
MEIRRTSLILSYEDREISEKIAPYLLDLRFTDHAHGKADDLQISVEDSAGLWRGAWFPQEGAKIRASLVCHNCDGDQKKTLPMGLFGIDGIEVSGPPSTARIKAASALVSTALRRELRSYAWENITLSAIAGQIANWHGLALYWDAETNVRFNRADQREESDLTFLSRLCRDNGYNLKAAEEKLIVYQAKKFDQRPATLTLTRQKSKLIRYAFASKSHDVFRAAQVSYADAEDKSLKTYTFVPPDPPACGHILKINKRAESGADAQRIAIAGLRRQNKDKVTGSVTVAGNPLAVAGINVQLDDFGLFTGKYFVETATHTINKTRGYLTELKIRKVLSY